jgi:hypothetical protein
MLRWETMQAVILILIGESDDIYKSNIKLKLKIVKNSMYPQRKGFGRALDKV